MLDQLNVATYKGVRFACNDTSTTAGRALVKHEFANSNKNAVEDQGLDPRVYRLTAIISGENYKADRDRLIAAIESRGPGVLIHPFYGRIANAVALPVTFEESVKRLGRIEIPITFEISDSEGIPTVEQRSTGEITSLKNDLILNVVLDFAAAFSVTAEFTGNFAAAASKVTGFVTTLTNSIGALSASGDQSASYRSRLDSLSRNVGELVSQPSELAGTVTGLINDLSTLYSDADQTTSVVRRFFEFGSNDSPINPATAGLSERRRNALAFNEMVKATALAVGYEASALTDYRTVDDVDEASRELERVYGGIVNVNQSTLNSLADIRVATSRLLNDQKLSAARVVSVNRNTRPARLLAFDYYGTSSGVQDLIDLNGNINVPYFDGDIRVLTQ